MSFYRFVQEYGEPYGVTVESLLTKPVAESRPSDRQHSAPEREAAETTKAAETTHGLLGLRCLSCTLSGWRQPS